MTLVTDGPSSTEYRYDDSGQRTIERGPAGETAFVNPWVTTRNRNEMFKHIWVDNDRIATQRDDGPYEELKRYFLHKDLQGSTNVVTDAGGETFQHHEYFPNGDVVDRREEHAVPHAVPVRWRLHRRDPRHRQLRRSLVRPEPGAVLRARSGPDRRPAGDHGQARRWRRRTPTPDRTRSPTSTRAAASSSPLAPAEDWKPSTRTPGPSSAGTPTSPRRSPPTSIPDCLAAWSSSA